MFPWCSSSCKTNGHIFRIVIALALTVMACDQRTENISSRSLTDREEFKNYWYAGQAEINVYSLVQSRYGENRQGKAVLIFVTEDLNKKKQVKTDNPDLPDDEKVNVLKLNFVKSFLTGVYPYSMMQSVFTPVQRHRYPHSLKTTMSVQEWCGHVYTQLNFKGNRYRVKSHSYFEQEGDEDYALERAWLEDEVWTIIRLDHTLLPEGEVKFIPALFYTRLRHFDLQPLTAVCSKAETDSTVRYTITYADTKRTLALEFEKNFPYKILSWEETFSERNQLMTTSGRLEKTILLDYWTKNKNEFQYLRDSLGLHNPF
jgi:hypothetical protein